jgi:hypothetical protein
MPNSENKDFREDRFTWNAGDFKFLTPEENKKRLEEKAAKEKENQNKNK